MKALKNFLECSFSLLFFLLIIQNSYSQTPPPDLNGEALKTWLKQNFYDGNHTQLGYDNARMRMYNYIDNHNNTLTGVYSGLEVNWTYGGTGTNPAPLNCEHTVPQSFFDYSEPMKSDIHHLFPTYLNWNSTRSNYPFAEIDDNITAKWMYLDQSQTTIPTSNIELYSEYANSTFEPREDHKGDCARSIFYFYTMYPTQAGDINSVGDINTLYQWHLDDPVSAKETQRNSDIQTYQGDLNPYVDQPDLVARAWEFIPDPTVPAAPVLALNATVSSLDLGWNNVANEDGYRIYRSDDGTNYSLLAGLAANSISYQDFSVSLGIMYSYYIIAYNAEGNSNSSNIISGQLNDGSETASDLLFSEYIEGSSYNKALEIANFTGASVDLSNYSIFKQTNGAGDWASELALSGSLAHGDVYVVAHSSAGAAIQAVADLSTGSQAVTFNGNDALALFKSGVLIDEIGYFNSSANYAIDVTMVRKSSVTSPNTTYTTSEWDVYGQDTFTYLGSHTMDLGTPDTEAPSIPTGLLASTVTETSFTLSWNSSTDNVAVTGYDVFKDGVFYASTSLTSYNINGLSAGTSYAMTIKAKDAAGNISAASTALNVTTIAPDTEAPSIPTGLLASVITETTFTLNWNTSSDNVGVIGYDIYKNGTFYGSATSTSLNITGLSAWTSYDMTVKAKDEAGNISAASSILVVQTIDTHAPSMPDGLVASNITETTFTLDWNASTDNVAVTGYDVYKDGSFLGSSTVTTYDITGLSAGITYDMTIIAKDEANNSSVESASLFVTTNEDNPDPGPASDLIISEYIEGSSYNKALEIANFTGASVDLSNYSIFKQTNGAGDWVNELVLSGTLAHGDVYVVANSLAGPEIQAVADLLTGSLALTFNGNDPVALFKSGQLIDIIGIFNATSNFAKDKTLVRVATINSPNSSYTTSEWDSYGKNTFTYLGTHTMEAGIPDTKAPGIPAGLLASTVTESSFTLSWNASTDNVAVTGYDVFKDGVFYASTSLTSCNVTGLTTSTMYSMTVKAKDEAGNISAASTALDVTTTAPDTEAPTTPDGLVASNITETSFTLEWNASTDNVSVTGYDVYKDGSFLGSSTVTTYDVTGLSAAITYDMTIIAKDAANNSSAESASLFVTTNENNPGPVELLYTDFEGSFGVWTDGGRDCLLYKRGTYATQGSYAGNIQDNSGISSSFYLTNGLDLHTDGYTELTIDFNFIPVSMETGEDFFVEFFDGTDWNILVSLASGSDFDNNNTYAVSIPVYETDYTFASNANLRFRCDASDDKDDIFIDEIRVTASAETLKLADNGGFSIKSLGKSVTPSIEDLELAFNVYPSPADNYTTINLDFEEDLGEVEINIFDMQGRVVYKEIQHIFSTSIQQELDISQLDKGIYLVMVSNAQFKISKKLIVH